MLANNETGAIQPVDKLAALASARGIPVHTDAVQAVGRIPVDFRDLGVTTLAASATSSTGRRGSACSWSGPGSGSARGSSAAASSKGGGRGPSRSPWRSGWPRPSGTWHDESHARIARWTALRDRLESGLIAALGHERVDPQRARSTMSCGSPRRSTSASPASTATPC